MSKLQEKTSENLAVSPHQIHTQTTNEVAEENDIYVAQLHELVRIFSLSTDQHTRQYIINLAKGVLQRADDYRSIEAYVGEMLS